MPGERVKAMPESILDADNDILKMLVFDPNSDCVMLRIHGKNPANYQVTPSAMLDESLKKAHPDHVDALLDARNYLYKKDASDATTVG